MPPWRSPASSRCGTYPVPRGHRRLRHRAWWRLGPSPRTCAAVRPGSVRPSRRRRTAGPGCVTTAGVGAAGRGRPSRTAAAADSPDGTGRPSVSRRAAASFGRARASVLRPWAARVRRRHPQARPAAATSPIARCRRPADDHHRRTRRRVRTHRAAAAARAADCGSASCSNLELDAVIDYGATGTWLRVPLGKLATERVPLDHATLQALDAWTQRRGTHRPIPHPRTGRPTDFLSPNTAAGSAPPGCATVSSPLPERPACSTVTAPR